MRDVTLWLSGSGDAGEVYTGCVLKVGPAKLVMPSDVGVGGVSSVKNDS